jgi:hypothetical protein
MINDEEQDDEDAYDDARYFEQEERNEREGFEDSNLSAFQPHNSNSKPTTPGVVGKQFNKEAFNKEPKLFSHQEPQHCREDHEPRDGVQLVVRRHGRRGPHLFDMRGIHQKRWIIYPKDHFKLCIYFKLFTLSAAFAKWVHFKV